MVVLSDAASASLLTVVLAFVSLLFAAVMAVEHAVE